MRLATVCLAAGIALATAACTSTPEGGGAQQSSAETTVATDELRTLLTGKTASFGDGTRAQYLADGRYVFHGGGVHRGRYSFRDNAVCVVFETGTQRCDRYVRRGDRYTLINASGRRYPVRIG